MTSSRALHLSSWKGRLPCRGSLFLLLSLSVNKRIISQAVSAYAPGTGCVHVDGTPCEPVRQSEEAYAAFVAADADGNGLLSLEEITHVLLMLGEKVWPKEVMASMQMDADPTTVTLQEFVHWWMLRGSNLPVLLTATRTTTGAAVAIPFVRSTSSPAGLTPVVRPVTSPSFIPTQARMVQSTVQSTTALSHGLTLREKIAKLKKRSESNASQTGASTQKGAAVTENAGHRAAGIVMQSPCATLSPPPPHQAILSPIVAYYSPPVGCFCKEVLRQGMIYTDCAAYDGKYGASPICVVKDPACDNSAFDAGFGNGEKFVKCVQVLKKHSPYSVDLVRSTADQYLGIDVRPDMQQKNLLVMGITGGIVQEWNDHAFPQSRIQVGDLILAINDKQGSAAILEHELTTNQKLHIHIAMQRMAGFPVVVSATVSRPSRFKHGNCPSHGHAWGDFSVCLNTQKAFGYPDTGWLWHCPWESMMLVSTKKFGGCQAVKYDCEGTNLTAVLNLYKAHDTMGRNHAPEGSLQTVEYVKCCIKSQCLGGQVATCGDAPWIDGKSVSPWTGSENPCGPAGCERRYDVTHSISAVSPPTLTNITALSALSVFAAVGAIGGVWLRIRRSTAQATETEGVGLQVPIEEMVEAPLRVHIEGSPVE